MLKLKLKQIVRSHCFQAWICARHLQVIFRIIGHCLDCKSCQNFMSPPANKRGATSSQPDPWRCRWSQDQSWNGAIMHGSVYETQLACMLAKARLASFHLLSSPRRRRRHGQGWALAAASWKKASSGGPVRRLRARVGPRHCSVLTDVWMDSD